MTRAEAIKYAEDKVVKLQLTMDRPESMYGAYAIYSTELEFVSAALHALRFQADAPPNAPLPLEELREMDGEPVWVVTGSAINAGRGCWDICDWWDKNTVMFPYSGEQPRVDDYGITWTAYRRKPEEGVQ